MLNLMPGGGLGRETSNRLAFGLGSWGEGRVAAPPYIYAAASLFKVVGAKKLFSATSKKLVTCLRGEDL